MLYIFLLFSIICFIKAKYRKIGFKDYISKEQTINIKGIFAIIIFFSHFNQYINLEKTFSNNIYLKIFSLIGQLMVAIFLFYSGYGIYYSTHIKENYIRKFCKNRILKTLLNFDLAVCLYLILNILIGTRHTIQDVTLSFIGWISIRQ